MTKSTDVKAAIGYLLSNADKIKSVVIVWEETDKGMAFACSNTTISNAVGMFEVAKYLLLTGEIGEQRKG